MGNRTIKIVVFSVVGVVLLFGLFALVARYINKNDIGLGVELPAGETAYVSIDDTIQAEVTVYAARELSESEAIRLSVSANDKTLVAVELSVNILDSGYSWGVGNMRVRDGKGKYGEVVAYRSGLAICRIENPSEQISFFIYTGDWTTSSGLKSTGRYKLAVEPAADDPVAGTRRGLEQNRLVIQGLAMDLEEGYTYTDHFVQEDWVYLEYEDMVIDVNIHAYTDIDMDVEKMIKQNRVIGGNKYEMIAEAAPADLNGTPWYHIVYEKEGMAHSAYFLVEDNVSYIIAFRVEGAASNLDQQRITAMMETAVLE